MNSDAQIFPRKFYSVDETAKMMGCTEVTIRRWIAQGHLESVKIGGRRLIPASFIDNLTRSAAKLQERNVA